MADFSALIAQIEAYVKQNGNNEITGNGLQSILVGMVNALGTVAITALQGNLADEVTARTNADGAINAKIPAEASSSNKLADKAFVTAFTTPLQNAVNAIKADIENGYVYAGIATPSGTPVSGKVFYLARQAGTYTNFGGLTLTEGVNVLKYNGTAWSQEQLISIADIYKNPLMGYYECDTAGGTAAKTVAATGYVLPATGGSVKIKMANRNTVANATLNINSTGAKPLFYNGVRAGVGNTWDTNEIVEVFYDGTNYQAYNVAGSNGDGVFDISTYNLTDGQPTPYVDLSAALGTNGVNIPESIRKGGMNVKFIQGTVQSTDNNYVQFRYMLQYENTTEGNAEFIRAKNWQGVDEVLTGGSKNLISSGGAAALNSLLAAYSDKVVFNMSVGGDLYPNGVFMLTERLNVALNDELTLFYYVWSTAQSIGNAHIRIDEYDSNDTLLSRKEFTDTVIRYKCTNSSVSYISIYVHKSLSDPSMVNVQAACCLFSGNVIDEKPLAESTRFVESGGVYDNTLLNISDFRNLELRRSGSVQASTNPASSLWKYIDVQVEKGVNIFYLSTTIAPTKAFTVRFYIDDNTYDDLLVYPVGKTFIVRRLDLTSHYKKIRLLFDKADNNGSTWTAQIYNNVDNGNFENRTENISDIIYISKEDLLNYYFNAQGVEQTNNYTTLISDFVQVKQNATYAIERSTPLQVCIWFYDKSKQLTRNSWYSGTVANLTTNSNEYFVKIGIRIDGETTLYRENFNGYVLLTLSSIKYSDSEKANKRHEIDAVSIDDLGYLPIRQGSITAPSSGSSTTIRTYSTQLLKKGRYEVALYTETVPTVTPVDVKLKLDNVEVASGSIELNSNSCVLFANNEKYGATELVVEVTFVVANMNGAVYDISVYGVSSAIEESTAIQEINSDIVIDKHLLTNGYVNLTSHQFTYSQNTLCSHLLRVKPNSTYLLSGNTTYKYGFAFYDIERNFISLTWFSVVDKFSTPSNARFAYVLFRTNTSPDPLNVPVDSFTGWVRVQYYNANAELVQNQYSILGYEPMMEKLGSLNSTLSISRFMTRYVNTIVLSDRVSDYLVNFQSTGEKCNHVPVLSIIDGVSYTTLIFNSTERREKFGEMGFKMRVQAMSDVLAKNSNYTEIIISTPSSPNSIYTQDDTGFENPISANVLRGKMLKVGSKMLMFSEAYTIVDNQPSEGYMVVAEYNTSTHSFSNFVIPKFSYGGSSYDFTTSNKNTAIGSIVGVSSPKYMDFVNIAEYNGYYYTVIGGSEGVRGAVFKTNDFETFEYCFATEGDNVNNEFPIAFWNDKIYIASRRNPYFQSCYLQRYSLAGVLEQSVLMQDCLPMTSYSLISRPMLFIFDGQLYLCNNTINRRDAYFVKVDAYSVKNSYVVVEKNLGLQFNNFSFDTYDGDLFCAATYKQLSDGDNKPLCAIANLGNFIEYSEEQVMTKFKNLLLT